MKTAIYKILFVFVLFGSVVYTHAGNNDFTPRLSAKTLALDGLYIAGSDGLSNLVTNPSGLVLGNGSVLEISFTDRTGQQDYTHPVEGLYRTYRDDDIGFAIGGNWQWSSDLSIAAAYSKPVMYNTSWPYARYFRSGTTSQVSTFDMTNKMTVGGFSAAGAYRIDRFSFGLTLNYNQYESIVKFPVLNDIWPDYVEVEPGYQVSYEQDTWQFGFNLGVNWEISENLRLGVMMRSGQDLKFKGEAMSGLPAAMAKTDTNNTTFPAGTDDISMEAALPMILGAGIVYDLSETMTINVDFAMNMWGSLENSWQVEFTDPRWQETMSRKDEITGTTPDMIHAPDQNSFEAGVGFDYKNDSGPAFRFGYHYSQSPVSASALTMLFPEVDQHRFSFGINLQGQGYDVDLTLAYALGSSREVSPAENEYYNGKYSSDLLLAGITLHYGL